MVDCTYVIFIKVYLGELHINGSPEHRENEKVEYQIVVTVGSEDPVELIERCGHLPDDLAFGRRASTRGKS